MTAMYSLSTMRYRLFEMSNQLMVYRANLSTDFPGDCLQHMTVEHRIKLAEKLEAIQKQLDTLRLDMFDLQKG